MVGASPDLRQQILQTPRLWPRAGSRDSPIAAVVLIGGDVDALAGLLALRERQAFTVYAPQPVLDLLEQNRIFDVLDRSLVRRQALAPLEPVACAGGITLSLLPMPGKVPLYLEERGCRCAGTRADLRRLVGGERPQRDRRARLRGHHRNRARGSFAGPTCCSSTARCSPTMR